MSDDWDENCWGVLLWWAPDGSRVEPGMTWDNVG